MLDKWTHLFMLQRFYLSDSAREGIIPNFNKFIIDSEQGDTQLKK